MYCSAGKLNLPSLTELSKLLLLMLLELLKIPNTLQYTQNYNSCFQIASFKETNIEKYGNYTSTFKVKTLVHFFQYLKKIRRFCKYKPAEQGFSGSVGITQKHTK